MTNEEVVAAYENYDQAGDEYQAAYRTLHAAQDAQGDAYGNLPPGSSHGDEACDAADKAVEDAEDNLEEAYVELVKAHAGSARAYKEEHAACPK